MMSFTAENDSERGSYYPSLNRKLRLREVKRFAQGHVVSKL